MTENPTQPQPLDHQPRALQSKPEDIVAKEAEQLVRRRPIKRLIRFVVVFAPLTALLTFGFYLAVTKLSGKKIQITPAPPPQDRNVVSPKTTYSYKVNTPPYDPLMSFVYFGNSVSLFNPLNLYYLTKDYSLIGVPFFVSATNSSGKPWCFGYGKDPMIMSLDQNSFYCLENQDNKNIILKRLDLKGGDYKEYVFSQDFDLFSDSKYSRVVTSKDGDSVLIYSPSGAYIFGAATGTLNKIDLPLNLEIIKSINLSSTETALITTNNKVYRVNFSNHTGGIFDVNFIGLASEQLFEGLKSIRLSRDGRRLVFSISDPIEYLSNPQEVPNYQRIIAYNIDLQTAKVSDELNYEEKFLLSCANLVGNRYCVYRFNENQDSRAAKEGISIKDYNSSLIEILRVPSAEKGTRIKLDIIKPNQNYFFIKSPAFFTDERDATKFTWLAHVYSTDTKTLRPLTF